MNYITLKNELSSFAFDIKQKLGTTDKPLINMVINDKVDTIIKEYVNVWELKEKISSKVAEQYRTWLQAYSCKLHVK